jgi:hypothetical protein
MLSLPARIRHEVNTAFPPLHYFCNVAGVVDFVVHPAHQPLLFDRYEVTCLHEGRTRLWRQNGWRRDYLLRLPAAGCHTGRLRSRDQRVSAFSSISPLVLRRCLLQASERAVFTLSLSMYRSCVSGHDIILRGPPSYMLTSCTYFRRCGLSHLSFLSESGAHPLLSLLHHTHLLHIL